jgi:hypothetical protein
MTVFWVVSHSGSKPFIACHVGLRKVGLHGDDQPAGLLFG